MPWDIHNFDRRFERQRKHLSNECVEDIHLNCSEPHDITDADRTAIKQYIKHKNNEIKISSLSTTLSKLRNAADRSPIPLMEMEDIDDFNELTWALEFKYDCTESTRAGYRQQLSGFFKHHDREWAEQIDTANHTDYSYDPDRMWTEDEQKQLLDNALNVRDACLIALAIDSRQRIGALGTLRVGDVEIKGRYGIIKLNENARGLKGANGRVPITWSASYVADWLKRHPLKNDDGFDDAPLFTALAHATKEPGEPLKYQVLRRRIAKAAEAAGFEDCDPDKLKPHNFRHTGISEGLLHGEGDQRLNQLFTKWHPDSTQFDIYGNVRDEEMIDKFLEERGLKEPDEGGEGRRFEQCPWTSCGIELPPGDQRFCPGCGRALNQAAQDQLAEAEDSTYEAAKQAETPEQEAGVDFIREIVKDHPEVITDAIDAEVLAEAMADAGPTHPAAPESPADD